MGIEAPKIYAIDFERLLKEMMQLIPHYTPEWRYSEGDDGFALIKIFAYMLESIIQRINRVPARLFFEFLEMLGIELMPPQPARVPVSFFLSEDADQHVVVLAGTQIAANEIVFETAKTIYATPARLCRAYSSDVVRDELFECPPHVLSGESVTVFKSALTRRVRKGDRQIFVQNSRGLKPEDIIAIHGDGHKEYCRVHEVVDSVVHLEDVFEADYDIQSIVSKPIHFMVSEGRNLQQHAIYFGHKDILNITSEGFLIIRLENSESITKLRNPDNVRWEYWGEAAKQNDSTEISEIDWQPLSVLLPKNMGSCDICLQKMAGEIKERKINGINSRWLRCRLHNQKIDMVKDVKVDTVVVSNLNEHEASLLMPDMAFYNDVAIDLTTDRGTLREEIYPFGKRPKISDTFYVGCNEAFSKKGMRIAMSFTLYRVKDIPVKAVHGIGNLFSKKLGDKVGTVGELLKLTPQELQELLETNVKRATNILEAARKAFYDKSGHHGAGPKGKVQATVNEELQLSWEYWNGNGWTVIEDIDDQTSQFLKPGTGKVFFVCPSDIERTQVSGQESYWIRVRLVSGDYGKDLVYNGNQWVPGLVSPPVISDLRIEYEIGPTFLQHCLLQNNREFSNVSYESRTEGTRFAPFQLPEDAVRTLFLGFDRMLEKGPISLLFSLVSGKSLIVDIPKIEWYYFCRTRQWKILDILDDTHNLTRKGVIEFFLPSDFDKTSKFGHELYWIKACFKHEYAQSLPVIKGIYVNTTYAVQTESIKDEILGSSNGIAHQEYTFSNKPVTNEEVWINEMRTLSEDDRKVIGAEKGKDAISDVRDSKGEIIETWVKWEAVEVLLDSSSRDRHYQVERATGKIHFGDGIQGMIPPVGRNNIKAHYRTGGGVEGNIKAFELTTMKTSIPYVEKVNNFEPGEGGANTESVAEVIERGPQQIRHRDRAVTDDDFERIALIASRFIARTKCLVQDNRLKIVVIPKGTEDKPFPSFELMKTVENYILSRCINIIPSESIVVEKPSYHEVNVTVELVPTSMDIAASLEKETIKRLKEFLHPVTGGPEKTGWEFGRNVHLSDVYALLENIPGADYVGNLLLNGKHEDVVVGEFSTVCSGEHSAHVKPGGRYYGPSQG